MNFFSLIKEAFNCFFYKENYNPVISHEMQTEAEIWNEMYINHSLWLGLHERKNVIPLRLPTAIASEFSRLVFSESIIKIDGNSEKEKSKLINDFVNKLDDKFEMALAFGGMMFKPYVSHGKIFIDLIRADRFVPIAFSDDKMTSAIFLSKKTVGNIHYTLLEYHEFNVENQTHVIKNKVCKSMNTEYIGYECGFDEVPEWSGMTDEITFYNVEKPLFAYFRVPFANNVDLDSPLGVSVYANAVDLIRQADEQWARIEWEFQSKETMLDVGVDMIKNDKLPKHERRIFRTFDVDNIDGSFYNIFSPEIRDSSMFNGFNRILQRIEFNCGLAYGTLSDPQTVEKTAEEIRTSKQRSYTQVTAIQRNLEQALNDLIYIIDVYSSFCGMGFNRSELSCTWGDSVLEDTEKEFQRRLQMVTAGLLSKEKFIAWYFGCDESLATEYLPQIDNLFGGG